MPWRSVVLVFALGACDQVFDLDRAESPDAPDAPPGPDAPDPTCGGGRTVFDDRFEGPVICDPWGLGYEVGGTIEQSGGELQIRPRITNSAGCTSKAEHAIPRGGLIGEVVAVAKADGAYTAMNIGQLDSMQVINDDLYYTTASSGTKYAMAPYVPAAMRWWRLHGESGLVIASYSADGITWSKLGQRPASPGPGVIGVLAGLSINVASTGVVARFGRLLLCD